VVVARLNCNRTGVERRSNRSCDRRLSVASKWTTYQRAYGDEAERFALLERTSPRREVDEDETVVHGSCDGHFVVRRRIAVDSPTWHQDSRRHRSLDTCHVHRSPTRSIGISHDDADNNNDDKMTVGTVMIKLSIFTGLQCCWYGVVNALYCHVEVLGSIPGQGEIYTENFIHLGGAPSPLSCDE